MGRGGSEVSVDCTGVKGGGEGHDLRIDGGDDGKGGQLILVGYEKPPKDQLIMRVSGFVSWGCGMLLIKCLDAHDRGGNKFGNGRSSCVHEGSVKERGDRDAVPVLADGCVKGGGESVNAGGVGNGDKDHP